MRSSIICIVVFSWFVASCKPNSNSNKSNKDASITDTIIKSHSDTIVKSSDSDEIPTAPNKGYVENNYLIIPGERIGKIILGMNQEEVLKTLGKPSRSDAAMGKYVYTWLGKQRPYKSEVNVVTSYADSNMKNRSVKLIRTTSPSFSTKEGVHPDMDMKDILRLMPELKYVRSYESENHQAKTDLYQDKSIGIVVECLNYEPKLCVAIQVIPAHSTNAIMEF